MRIIMIFLTVCVLVACGGDNKATLPAEPGDTAELKTNKSLNEIKPSSSELPEPLDILGTLPANLRPPSQG